MINRFIGTSARLVQQMASQPVTWHSVTKTARGLLTTARHALTVFGLSAVAMLALLYARPELAHKATALFGQQPAANEAAVPAPAANVALAQAEQDEPKEVPNAVEEKSSKQQQFVTSWLSRRYRVANDAAHMFVSTAYSTAHDMKLDPLLILAVMAIESGLNPFAESPVGAKGLMQVMAKVHNDKFEALGGAQAALNPVANIRVGAQILKDYVTRTGSVELALKSYVGAGASDSDDGYGSRVLAEYHRLKQVAIGKKVPIYTPRAPAAPAPAVAVPAAVAPAAAPQVAAAANAAPKANTVAPAPAPHVEALAGL